MTERSRPVHLSDRVAWLAITFLSAIATTSAVAAAAPATAQPDLSTPTGALAAFAKALEHGDVAALAAAMTGDAPAQAWASALAAHNRALKDLEDALAKKYGKAYARDEAGADLRDQIEGAKDTDLLTDLKQAKLGKPAGDTVLIILDESASDDRQGRLVRVAGSWKVDAGSFSDYYAAEDVPLLKATAAAATALAKDVIAGKFATLDDAATAVDERLTAAEEAAAPKPAPAPGAKPAAAAAPAPPKP